MYSRFGEQTRSFPIKIELEKSELDIASTSNKFSEDFKVEIDFQELTKDRGSSDDAVDYSAKSINDNDTHESKVSSSNAKKRAEEEDIDDLESRLHQVLYTVETSDGERNSGGNAVLSLNESTRANINASVPIDGGESNNGEDFNFDVDDDGDGLIAALRAELEDDVL